MAASQNNPKPVEFNISLATRKAEASSCPWHSKWTDWRKCFITAGCPVTHERLCSVRVLHPWTRNRRENADFTSCQWRFAFSWLNLWAFLTRKVLLVVTACCAQWPSLAKQFLLTWRWRARRHCQDAAGINGSHYSPSGNPAVKSAPSHAVSRLSSSFFSSLQSLLPEKLHDDGTWRRLEEMNVYYC